MREIIHLLRGPSHYAGMEDGAVRKDPASVSLRIALAFPDAYEVGMSYLGQKILYGIINANPAWWAERVMEPDLDACALMREKGIPLATLESDTPLRDLDAVGFAVTHELCFTDILNMLDLAGIPLRAADRPDSFAGCPLVFAGGGAMLGAEPLSPFFDLVALGDGEELVPELLELLQAAKGEGRTAFLERARQIPGIYVPAFFEAGKTGGYEPLKSGYRPARRIVADLEQAFYPAAQVTPVGAVHNRLSLEIGRGCTRGCRFCHAGMVYRPCRERSPAKVGALLTQCLASTGYDEVSFLALSVGDCTALKKIYTAAWSECKKGQTGLCLPSLRVGSVDDEIMERMADLHRPGITLAPEAGSQRLRDVINKGVSEAELLTHVRKLLEYGWRQVKLYFMIGLPTETDEDLEAIVALCRKARDAAGPGGPKMQVTAAISPFVPKPFTPFQWEAQIGLPEVERRIEWLRRRMRGEKGLRLKWHEPAASFLEGLLSRGDRSFADVIEKAFRKGALFCAWHEHFRLEPWLEAMAECGMNPEDWLVRRDPAVTLPWEHLEAGVARDFLWRERGRAYAGKTTADCRFGACGQCGACDTRVGPSALARVGEARHRLVNARRDQSDSEARVDESGRLVLRPQQTRPQVTPALVQRAVQYRIWHCKDNGAEYLSQLELKAVLARAFRRAGLPVAFSQGYHPMPLISFGRALPVGCASFAEWFLLTLHSWVGPDQLVARLNQYLPQGLRVIAADREQIKRGQAISETFLLLPRNEDDLPSLGALFADFASCDSFQFTRQTPKGERTVDLRPFLLNWSVVADASGLAGLRFGCDWSDGYISPLLLMRAIIGENVGASLVKLAQVLPDGSQSPALRAGALDPLSAQK